MSKAGNYVGIDFNSVRTEVTEAVVEAIRQDNTGVEVDDYGIFVKIKAPGKMVIRQATIEEHLGRDFLIDELQVYLSSYFGFMEVEEDHVLIQWNRSE